MTNRRAYYCTSFVFCSYSSNHYFLSHYFFRYEKSHNLHDKVYGPEHPATLRQMKSFAVFLSTTGNVDEAEDVLQDLSSRLVRCNGKDDRESIEVKKLLDKQHRKKFRLQLDK